MFGKLAFAATALCALAALAGCASSGFAGVPLEAGAADADLQALARQARSGNRQALLELGIRYEEGHGVPRDPARARTLYRDAARGAGGTRMAFVPGTGGRPPMTIPINSGPFTPGLPEAAQRLARLEAEQAPLSARDAAPLPGAAGGIEAAFQDLVRLDAGFHACAGQPQPGAGGRQWFLDTRACLANAPRTDSCAAAAGSMRKVAALIVEKDAFGALAPAANAALRHCGGAAAARAADSEAAPTPIDVLRLEGTGAPQEARGTHYLQQLCPHVLFGGLADVRTSEILICSSTRLVIEQQRAALRTLLNRRF